jgi:hypothetical protein
MDTQVPYLQSATRLRELLNKISEAGEPEKFTQRFLLDLGFKSRNDRPFIGLLKYLGMLDPSGRPTASYSQFRNTAQSKGVLRSCLEAAYDDLFNAQPQADSKSKGELTDWFKTKSGKAERTAELMAATFLTLCEYAGSAPASAPADGLPPAGHSVVGVAPTTATAPVVSQHPLSMHIEVKLGGQAGTDYDAFFGALKKHLLSE